MSYVLKSLSPPHRAACLELAVLLDPTHSGADKPADDILSAIWVAASEVVRLYDEWHGTKGRPAYNNMSMRTGILVHSRHKASAAPP